jgi:7,8-dihydropterin-6-yl-methyl-4-(beta-D-ribofuranosyl)aminobenzene 5'-phosphate synthase
MKLTVLMDNNTIIDKYFLGEPAVSYFIEDEGTKILFDVGYSDAYIQNALMMNIDVHSSNAIVISHGHDDHTRGLKYFFQSGGRESTKMIAHPGAFHKKTIGDLEIGSPLSSEELGRLCDLHLSREPVKISENIWFLGEILRTNSFEAKHPIGIVQTADFQIPDELIDDTALVYKSKDGIFVITGCSHSGICNIIEQAKFVSGETKVLGVIGGFHLFELNEQTLQTIEYLKENDIRFLYPCHCTSFKVRAEMSKQMNLIEVGVGMILELE